MRKEGFTLVELMVALAVFAILVTIGLPSFTDFIKRYTAESAMMQIHKDLQTARSGAVSLGKPVTVCHLDSTGNCDNNWLGGISIFVDDQSTRGKFESGELKLAESNAIGTEHKFDRSSRNRVTYRADGQSPGFNGTFVFCPKGGEAKHYRGLILNMNGRVRASRDDNGDGIHEDSSGNKLACN